jgi:subtilisin
MVGWWFWRVLRVALGLAVLAPMLAFAPVGSVGGQGAEAPPLEVIPGRYIVMLDSLGTQSMNEAARAFDKQPGVQVDHVYDFVFRGFSASLSDAAAAALMRNPNVAAVHPDYPIHMQDQSVQPGINRVDADLNPVRAGNGSGSVDVDIAIIDSGVGPNSDVNMVGGYDCWGQGILRDWIGHGTHVAGIAAARDNGYGVVGVAPGARIWSVRVFNSSGNGSLAHYICGMEWVAEHSATIEVANMSLGGTTYDAGPACTSSPVHLAVCGMTQAGVTAVAAACNDGTLASICVPGRYPEVISVSAFAEWDGKPGGLAGCKWTPDGFYGCDDRRASFSNYGPTVDIAAIGVGVYSTLFDNRYGYWTGTSMATPHVTGAAALVLVQQGDMSPAAVRERLLLTGMSGPVPGDPDSYPEPILNVASLGKGTISAPRSTKPGQRIRVEAGQLIPNTKAAFRIDEVNKGSETVEANGTVDRTLTVPDLPYGRYDVTVVNHRKTLKSRILVRPLILLGSQSGKVGSSLAVTLKGFGAGESILLTFQIGTTARSVLRVRASANGVASGTFVVPSAALGNHRVTATDDSGHTTYVSFEVRPSLVAESPVAAGDYSSVVIRGFRSAETVELRWGSSTGAVLRTKSLTANGSGEVNVLIPANTTDGTHSLWAVGNLGTSLRVTVSTFGASEAPTPTAPATTTPSATATAPPTATPAPTESQPTETATQTPTSTTVSGSPVAVDGP